jgi:multidrug efflux system membrane fusion protein
MKPPSARLSLPSAPPRARPVPATTAGFALALLLVAGCRPPAAPAVAELPRVTVAPVETTRELPPLEAPGVLQRRLEATLSFKIGGVVHEIAVRAGESVRRGQVLARLNPVEIDAQVAQARSALAKAGRDAERVARLQAERVATLEQLQDARTGVEVAEAQLQVVEFNRRFATIAAPADGRILRRHAEPNELVGPGQPLLTFGADAEGWVFKAGLAEREARPLAAGAPATLVFQGPPEITLAAALTQLADAADPATRTFEAEFAVAGVPANLRSGAVGTLRLPRTAAAPLVRVPLGALLEGHGRRAYLFFLDADGRTVRRRGVEVETLHGATALLATALPAGTRIVTAGAEYLHDGETVAVAAPR